MKIPTLQKYLTLILSTTFFINMNQAQLCVADTSYTQPGVYPDTSVNLTTGCAGAFYLQDFTLVVPPDTTVFGYTFTINYFQIDSVGGLPPGMSFVCNPGSCHFDGGTSGCFQIYGVPPSPGVYYLSFYITGEAYHPLFGTVAFPYQYDGYELHVGNFPTLTTGNTSAICNGSNAMAWVSATGSTGYSYGWNTMPSSPNDTIAGVPAGIYIITVNDTFNCATIDTVIINDLGAPTIDTILFTSTLCYGDSTGTATANVSGGTPGYTYAWSNGDTTATIIGLPAAGYFLSVSDVNGCLTSSAVNINGPPQMFAFESHSDASCNGLNDGGAIITAVGGTGSYDYDWSSGDSTGSVSTLFAGTYTVIVTDDNGCTVSTITTISEPSALVTSTSSGDANCFGGADGTGSVMVSGGSPGYTYLWSNGDTTSNTQNLPVGTFMVTITDTNGCVITDSVTTSSPPVIGISLSGTDESIMFALDGTVDATVNGGTPGYTYLWSNSSTTQDITNLAGGTYVLTVTDTNGCTATDSITIQTIPGFGLETNEDGFKLYPNPAADYFVIETDEDAVIHIYDIYGRLVYDGSYEQGSLIIMPQSISSAPWQTNQSLHWPKGAYFVVVLTSTRKMVSKLILQ